MGKSLSSYGRPFPAKVSYSYSFQKNAYQSRCVISNPRTIQLSALTSNFARNSSRKHCVHVRCKGDHWPRGIGTRPFADHIADIICAEPCESQGWKLLLHIFRPCPLATDSAGISADRIQSLAITAPLSLPPTAFTRRAPDGTAGTNVNGLTLRRPCCCGRESL
jgi:hypothetical protein